MEKRIEGSNKDEHEPGGYFPHLAGDKSTPSKSGTRPPPPLVPSSRS
jgi:hypothetical protein